MIQRKTITLPRTTQSRGYQYRGAPTGAMLPGGGKLAIAEEEGGAALGRTGVLKKKRRGGEKMGGKILRVGTVTVGTMRGKSAELSEMMKDSRWILFYTGIEME